MLARDHVGDVEELKGSTLRLMQRTYKTNYLINAAYPGFAGPCLMSQPSLTALQGLGPKGIRGLAQLWG